MAKKPATPKTIATLKHGEATRKNIPTARTEDVSVLLSEHDGRDAVLLRTPDVTA